MTIARILAVAFVLFVSGAGDAVGQLSMNATAVEIAQLPQFCWAQFRVPNASGDEFSIHDCGPGANHYCAGLLNVIRAKHARYKGARVDELRNAQGNVAYTEEWIKGYPQCSIREHMEQTKAEINHLLMLNGAKPSGAR